MCVSAKSLLNTRLTGTKGESFASDKDRALKRIEEGLERSSDKYIFLHNRYKKKKNTSDSLRSLFLPRNPTFTWQVDLI